MKNLLFLSLGLFLVGCATPVYNAQSTISHTSKPPINSVNKVSVGDQMLIQGVMREGEALELHSRTKVGMYNIPAGQFLKTGDDAKNKFFNVVSTNGSLIDKNFMADPYKAIMTTLDGRLCVVTVFNVRTCESSQSFQIVKVASASENSFQQTLIYSGKVGNKINIGYREFSSSLARPAFNNDVEYDLSESRQIGYKGALLDIIEATNQSITYKVLKNFNTQ